MTKIIELLIIALLLSVASASATTVYCDNCTDCSQKIQNASLGDTVRLTQDIINCAGTCIDFDGADLITFDGGGHIIDGIDSYSYYGIQLYTYACNNVVMNCTISDFRHGVYLFTASYNTIRNVTAVSNVDSGICILYSRETTIKDCVLEENKCEDFYFRPNMINDCNTTLINVTGSGGRPIGFYNSMVNISDVEFSALYICNADRATFYNVTVYGSDILNNNAIRLYYTDLATLVNINSINNFMGIGLHSSDGCVVYDSDFSENHHYNIFVSTSNSNVFENVVSNSSGQCGMYLYHSSMNDVLNSTMCSSQFGLRLDTSPYSKIKGSYFTGNEYGISMGKSYTNLIYNNYFDNTYNVNIGTGYANNWNTTNRTETNIISGPYIGGNYWNDYIGFPTSATGFGEQPHVIGIDNIDYLPLVPVGYPQMYIRNGGYDLNVSETWQYMVTCRNASGIDVDCGELTWNSSNEAVGVVDNANFTALAAGSTNITVTGFCGMTDEIVQNVTDFHGICGDVDCDEFVTINDVIDTYMHVVNQSYQLSSYWAANVDGDEYTTINDVIEIYLHVVNQSHQLYCTGN